jgi:hypothetical protein
MRVIGMDIQQNKLYKGTNIWFQISPHKKIQKTVMIGYCYLWVHPHCDHLNWTMAEEEAR